ncbi:unnamed protein product [Leuciscus chuanchicus]
MAQTCNVEEVVDLVILEQFIAQLSRRTAEQVEEQRAPLALQLKDEATSPQSHTQTPDLGHKGGMSESGGGAPPFQSLPSLCQSLGPLSAARAVGKPGPACWRCRDPFLPPFLGQVFGKTVETLIRVPDSPQAAPIKLGSTKL